jgi:hypothetical protein
VRDLLEKIARVFEEELRAVTAAADRLGFALQDYVGGEPEQRMLGGGEVVTAEPVQDSAPEPAPAPEAGAAPLGDVAAQEEPQEVVVAPEEPVVATNGNGGHHDHHEPTVPKQTAPAPANPCPVCASTGNCTRCGGKGRRHALKCSRCQGRGSCSVCAGVSTTARAR